MVGPTPPTWAVQSSSTRTFALMPGLWQLRLPTPWNGLSHANAFVLELGGGGIALVDCGGGGHPSAWRALCAGLAEIGRSVREISQLIITHYHSDHAGAAALIVAESGCRVAGHPATGHAFEAWESPRRAYEGRRELARRDGIPADLLHAFATVEEELTGFEGPVAPDDPLTDGVRLSTALGEWEVLETPGHSPSHVCLFQRDQHLLIAGDLIAPTFVPYFDLGHTEDPAGETIASLGRASALGARRAFPGHGRVIENVEDVLRAHIAEMERLISTQEDALDSTPKTVFEVLRALHPNLSDPIALVWRWCETGAGLRHLALSGRAQRWQREDGTFLYARSD